MNLNTRRNFIRNTALGMFALSTGSFAVDNNTRNLNLAKLFKGGVRFVDVKKIMENCFPELLNKIVLVKVRCNANNHLHSIASAEFLQNVENLKSKHSDIKIDAAISKNFDVAHYNYQAYLQLLKIELNNVYELVLTSKSKNAKEVNLFITSDIGRNHCFNDLNEIEELSGLDHDGDGANETFALFYSSTKKIEIASFSKEIILQENLFNYFERMIVNTKYTQLNS